MRYAVITFVNGAFKVEAECGENKAQARTFFYQKCAALSNAPDVVTAMVKVVNSQLDCVDGLMAFFSNPVEGTEAAAE